MLALKAAKVTLFVAVVLCCDFRKANGRDFSYGSGRSGPDHWEEDYSACGGKHQSPININLLEVVKRPYFSLNFSHFHEVPTSAELLNNGHTVVVKLEFAENAMPTVTDGPLNEAEFVFSQFHFHWGENDTVGSEDRINNQSFPAELHMVFYNAKYGSFEDSLKWSDGVAVLAFFYAIQDDDNPNYVEFTELLQDVREPDTRTAFLNPPTMSQLIVQDIDNYYTYTGSLTTPPCSEDVTWIDFATPIMISTEQIERFRRLNTHGGTPLKHNFRPIQPLNNRTVYKARPFDLSATEEWSSIPFIDINHDEIGGGGGGGAAAGRFLAAHYYHGALSALCVFILKRIMAA